LLSNQHCPMGEIEFLTRFGIARNKTEVK